MYYIYMLRCRDGSFYTGIAADIEKRLRQHASGGAACAKYTRAHPPEALAALWQAEDHAAAARLEALIKQLPSGVSFEILGQQSFYIGMVFHELYFNFFLYIIKTSENERYLNEKCFFLKKSFFR